MIPVGRQLMALLAAGAIGAACGSSTPGGTSHSQVPQLIVGSHVLDFGALKPGTDGTAAFTVTNAGQGQLTLGAAGSAPTVDGDAASEFVVSWPPNGLGAEGLGAGASVAIEVRFSAGKVGRRRAQLVLESNDPAAPSTAIDLVAFVEGCQWEADREAIDFGVLALYAEDSVTLTLRNVSEDATQSCSFSGFAIDDSSGTFAFAVAPPSAAALASGETLKVVVIAAPHARSAVSSALTFNVDGDASPTTIALKVVCDECLRVNVPALDFGSVYVGCDKPRQHGAVDVATSCSTPVALASVTLESTDGPFTATAPASLTITRTAPARIKIDYLPTAAGTYSNRLVATTDSGLRVVVELRGSSEVATEVREEFEQPTAMDVLLLIDNSCSMSDKQALLARQIAELRAAVESRGIDTRLEGLVEAYPTSSGTCSQWWDAKGGFHEVSVACPANGALLENAVQALPQLGEPNGFIRRDAALAIVVYTDGTDPDPRAASYYAGQLLLEKGPTNRNRVYFAAIIPTEPQQPPYSSGCSYDSDGFNSSLLKDVATLMGGVYDEICRADPVNTLAYLSNPRRVVLLTHIPDPARTPMVSVTVDGVAVPATSWTYSATINKIDIAPSVSMPIGSKVAVSYLPACD